jgi:hypothetical protein
VVLPTRPTSQEQEQDVSLQSFPAETPATDTATAPGSKVGAEATEVALFAFSSEQNDQPALPIDSSSAPSAPAPAPIFVERDPAASGTWFPRGRWAFAAIVCCVAIAAGAVFAPARVPAEPLPAGVTLPAIDGGAAIRTSTEPTQTPTGPTATEPQQEAPAHASAPAPAPALAQAPAPALRREAPGPRTAAEIPGPEPTALPPTASTYSGYLAVSSSPAGAQVFVNGAPVGVTPLLLSDLAAGSRVVRLELAGYERWSSAVRIIASEETKVDAQLRPSSIR